MCFCTALRIDDGTPQLITTSNAYGGGKYNASVAAQVRWNRIQDSMARNPTFDFTTPRYFTAYAESAFPYRFFVDGRNQTGQLDLTVARNFFQEHRFPKDFYRRNGSIGFNEIGADIAELFAVHEIAPGHNEGAGNYVLDPEDPGFNGVRSSIDFNRTCVITELMLPNTPAVLPLYQTHKCHVACAVPEPPRCLAGGAQGEYSDFLRLHGLIVYSTFPIWHVMPRSYVTINLKYNGACRCSKVTVNQGVASCSLSSLFAALLSRERLIHGKGIRQHPAKLQTCYRFVASRFARLILVCG